jgi:hypothetical protein
MEWIGFGNGIYWNGKVMDLKGMEWNILEWKVMDTFGVGGLPSCLDSALVRCEQLPIG